MIRNTLIYNELFLFKLRGDVPVDSEKTPCKSAPGHPGNAGQLNQLPVLFRSVRDSRKRSQISIFPASSRLSFPP